MCIRDRHTSVIESLIYGKVLPKLSLKIFILVNDIIINKINHDWINLKIMNKYLKTILTQDGRDKYFEYK